MHADEFTNFGPEILEDKQQIRKENQSCSLNPESKTCRWQPLSAVWRFFHKRLNGTTTVAPTATLEVAPATVVDAQPNYVTEQPLPPREIPFRPTMDRSEYDAAKARANFYGPGAPKPFTETFAPLATPAIRLTNFSGHSATEGLRPPDTHGAVGTTHFVQVTNSHIDMWTRQNTATLPLAKSVTLATFFGYTTETLFDPRVVYDSTWNRWIVTADAFAESSTVQRFFIAVSTTADPRVILHLQSQCNLLR